MFSPAGGQALLFAVHSYTLRFSSDSSVHVVAICWSAGVWVGGVVPCGGAVAAAGQAPSPATQV